MDQNMTLEKRIAAELYSYQGRMSVFVDDLRGSTVEIGADEEFETASTIKAFILAVLYLQASRGRADLEEEITYEASQFVDGSGMLRALGVGAKLKVKDTATMMIICSDNIATNMIIDYLGLDTINACIRELGFGHTVLHNPLHFDRYDKRGDRRAGAYLGGQQERQHERLPQRWRHHPHPLRRVCDRSDEQGVP